MHTKKILKAAVIGLGVGERHIANYETDPRCKVVALCDTNSSKLAEVGRKYPDCRLSSDAEEILKDPDIDVVSIASYDNFHCEQTLLAIANGKHVFVEKPLCLLDKEFDQIDSALLAHPEICLSSNLVLRRAPHFMEVKKKIDSGKMGNLYYFEGDYNYGRLHKITAQWRGEIPFYSVSHGGGIHLIDLILWLSGGKIVKVVAEGNKIASAGTQFRYPDMMTAILMFNDGMMAKVSANFGCVVPHHHALAVYGTEGSYVQNFQGAVFYHSRNPEIPADKIDMVYPKDEKGGVQRAFVAQILDGTKPEVTIPEVMDAMAVSLAIERSMKSHQWEDVRFARVSQLSP